MANSQPMKKTIRIYFVDFWNGFDPGDNFFINRLKIHYNVVLDAVHPELLFYSYNGIQHFRYDKSITIYFSGENDVPDFNLSDYAISFHPVQFEDRHLRLPLFVLYKCFPDLDKQKISSSQELLQRKFCAFVVSNSKGADRKREDFFHKLNEYKKVDSGGRYLNNTGSPVADKLEFIKGYKFVIAFENSAASGYTTEKLIEPLAVNSVPIYWGNPNVNKDFNSKSFVNAADFKSLDELVQEIIRLDNDDDAYLSMAQEHPFTESQKKSADWINDFDEFMDSIIQQEPENAIRRTRFGYAKFYTRRYKLLFGMANLPGIRYVVRKLSYR